MKHAELVRLAEYHRGQAERFRITADSFRSSAGMAVAVGASLDAAKFHQEAANWLTELADTFAIFNHVALQG